MRFLSLIFGTMGCGKTAELLKKINRLQEHNSRCRPNERQTFAVFKPTTESRHREGIVMSRGGHTYAEAITVNDVQELAAEIAKADPDVILIDECQFFEIGAGNNAETFIFLIRGLLDRKKQVVLCGLIQNCYGGKFEILSALCPEADEIINPHTACHCGQVASRTQRLQIGYPTPITDPVFVVDDTASHDLGISYEARCNNCWELPNAPHPYLALFRKVLSELTESKMMNS